MRRPRFKSSADDVRTAGDTGEPKKQPTRINPNVLGPVAASFITAACSLLLFSFSQLGHIDARLDELEEESRLLMLPDGTAVPSRQALDAYYGVESLKKRVSLIEGQMHFHGK